MGKWLNLMTEEESAHILNQGDKVDNVPNTTTLSTVSPHISRITNKKSYTNICKEEELKCLIKKISDNYGGDDKQFLEDYINDIINNWSHDLDAALACFRVVADQRIEQTRRKS